MRGPPIYKLLEISFTDTFLEEFLHFLSWKDKVNLSITNSYFNAHIPVTRKRVYKDGFSYVITTLDVVFFPRTGITVTGMRKIAFSLRSVCILFRDGSVSFFGDVEDFEGVETPKVRRRNREIKNILATDHAFALIRETDAIFVGSGCFGGRYKYTSGRLGHVYYRQYGIVFAEVVGKRRNKFHIVFRDSAGKINHKVVGCAGNCLGHHPSFFL